MTPGGSGLPTLGIRTETARGRNGVPNEHCAQIMRNPLCRRKGRLCHAPVMNPKQDVALHSPNQGNASTSVQIGISGFRWMGWPIVHCATGPAPTVAPSLPLSHTSVPGSQNNHEVREAASPGGFFVSWAKARNGRALPAQRFCPERTPWSGYTS